MLFGHFFRPSKKKRIYLDYAAATPVRSEVVDAMRPYFTETFGNPSAVHKEGVTARIAIDEAREDVARTLRIRATDVIFTSGGTESNNLAIYGVLRALHENSGTSFSDIEIVSCKTEHPSTLRVLEHMAETGVDVKYVGVDEDGLVIEDELKTLLSEKTALVTFAYANSEVGVVQQVKRLTRIVRAHNTAVGSKTKVHLDASQAPLWLPIEMDALGVDLMTLDAGKCYGPKGVGVLARKHGVDLKGIVLGGSQESGLRAGTENTPLIVGCARALDIAVEGRESRSVAVATLRDSLIALLEEKIDGCVLNGSHDHRIANNINISIPGIDSEFAVVTLDTYGIAASTKSACGGKDGDGSYVVREMIRDDERSKSTIRFSLGEATTQAEIEKTVEVLAEHVRKMRAFNKTLSR